MWPLHRLALALSAASAASPAAAPPFAVLWSSCWPQGCAEHNTTVQPPVDWARWRITTNPNASTGDGPGEAVVVSTWYSESTGRYPWVADPHTPNGVWHNGGLPQLANLTAHLSALATDVDRWFPAKDFSGAVALDWEYWQPSWDANIYSCCKGEFAIYNNLSTELVLKRHPDWSLPRAQAQAKTEYNAAARTFMVRTLQTLQTLRPAAKWG